MIKEKKVCVRKKKKEDENEDEEAAASFSLHRGMCLKGDWLVAGRPLQVLHGKN